MFRIFEVSYLKTRNFGMVHLYLKATICKALMSDPLDLAS